jgi:biotin carboxylase
MYRFLKREKILGPKFRVFKKGITQKSILNVAKGLKYPLVIKPTLGAGNTGVRFVRSAKDLWKQYSSTLKEVNHHGFETFDFRPWAGEWIMCEFVEGKEVEADLYVEKGKIKFKIVQDKPLLVERNGVLEENTSVTPPVSLTRTETQNLDKALLKLAKVVYERLARPCGIKYFTLYPEYIIDKNGTCHCLEFALRICGAIGPMIIQKSTGVNMMEIFARASLGLKTRIKKRKVTRAVCWQTLLSDRCGIFCGLKGLGRADTFMYAKKGDYILTPQSDYIASVITEGKSPHDALDRMALILKDVRIIMKTKNGIEKIPVTIPRLAAY